MGGGVIVNCFYGRFNGPKKMRKKQWTTKVVNQSRKGAILADNQLLCQMKVVCQLEDYLVGQKSRCGRPNMSIIIGWSSSSW